MVNWKTPRRRKQARQFSTIEALESRVLLSATCDIVLSSDGNDVVEAEVDSSSETNDSMSDAETLNHFEEFSDPQQDDGESMTQDRVATESYIGTADSDGGAIDVDNLASWEGNYGAVVESDSSSPTLYSYDAIGNLVATVDESESLNTDIDTDIENLTLDSEFDTVNPEFGHELGIHHEHQNPTSESESEGTPIAIESIELSYERIELET